MIKNFNRSQFVCQDLSGSVSGQMGSRDVKMAVNSVSGEIETDSQKVVAISNYNRWLAQEVLRRNAEAKNETDSR